VVLVVIEEDVKRGAAGFRAAPLFLWNRGECLLRCLGERYAVSFRAGVPGMRGWFL